MNLHIFGHGGSQNHGNEAIVRGIKSYFPDYTVILHSWSTNADKKFGLGKLCIIKEQLTEDKGLLFKIAKWLSKNTPIQSFYNRMRYKNFVDNIVPGDLYLLEAADQYYEGSKHIEMYIYLNKMINKKGGKTVMFGCSINSDILSDKRVVEDLNRYSLIIAREGIAYDAIINSGVKTRTILSACPAFMVEPEKVELPSIFDKDVIGINFGFLGQGNHIYTKIMMKNYDRLVKYILKETDYNIAFIPSVNWDRKYTDITYMKRIYERHKCDRLYFFKEMSVLNNTYVYSKCKMMIALRTHTTIPALTVTTPVIMTGYKTKTTGVYRQMYEEGEDMLLSIQSLTNENELIEKFKWLEENYDSVKKDLCNKIPKYKEDSKKVREEVLNLID